MLPITRKAQIGFSTFTVLGLLLAGISVVVRFQGIGFVDYGAVCAFTAALMVLAKVSGNLLMEIAAFSFHVLFLSILPRSSFGASLYPLIAFVCLCGLHFGFTRLLNTQSTEGGTNE